MITRNDLKKVMSLDQGAYQVGLKNSKTREDWLKKVLSELHSGLRLLDAGAGECQFKKYCTHLQYVSQDFSQYDGQGNTVGLQTGKWDNSQIDIVSDITKIPEPDGSFDVVLCTEVLEHLPEPAQALREFSRLLRIGGFLIMTAPFNSLTHFAPYHFSTGFNQYFYMYHLEKLGFELRELIANGNFFEFMGQELRRVPDVAQHYCDEKLCTHEKYAIQVALGMLERLSAKDKGSEELLHFDYQVLAVKVC